MIEPSAQCENLPHLDFPDGPSWIVYCLDFVAIHWCQHGYRYGHVEFNQDLSNSIEQADNFDEVRAHNVDAQESHNKKQDKHRWKGNLQGKHDRESISPDERQGVIS